MTARWQDVAETGGALGIRLLVLLATAFGRPAARALLYPVAAWYVAFHGRVRRASRAYLLRVRGRATFADVYRHVLCFARVTLDRLFLARGRTDGLVLGFHGEEHLRALRAAGRGALLLLAHVGSFEVMRAASTERSFRLNVVGYFRNARRINDTLRRLNPAIDANLIEIRPNDPGFVFDIGDRIEAGELVGTMGDRVGHDGKAVTIDFLGAPARFPTGPYALAAALGCPVYLCFGLYTDPDRYDLHCEPFAERIALPRDRDERERALRDLAARYAARLEAAVRSAPENWFNFYEYWSAT